MKVKAGDLNVELPTVAGKICGVIFDCLAGAFYVPIVAISEIEDRRKQAEGMRGTPTQVALARDNQTVEMFPAPDVDGELIVTYYPAIRCV